MAKYVRGSKEWLDYMKEAIITSGDLLAHQENLTPEEVEDIAQTHWRLVLELFDYTEETEGIKTE